tara:strand:+ start:223 stop:474 length:252 start_codon:yes stop_codon:yes gene_type:complete
MLKDYKLTTTIRLLEGSEEHLLSSIQEGMELDSNIGEGILHWSVQEVEPTDDDEDDDGAAEFDLSTMAGRKAKWLATRGHYKC